MNAPEGWKIVNLSDVCLRIVGGGTPPKSNTEYWEGDIDWISSADIYGLRDIRPRLKINNNAISNSATNLVPEGTIIVVTRVGLGKIGIAPQALCFNQDCQGIIIDPDKVTQKFMLYVLSQAVLSFQSISRGTTVSGITKKQLAETKILLPPISTQEKIVAKIEELLSELDKGITETQNASMSIEAFKESKLQQLFQPSDSMEKGWEKVNFEDIADNFKRGPFGSAIKKSFFVSKGFKVYEQKNAIYDDASLGTYFINESKFKELSGFEVIPGDFIVSCSGTVGRISQLPNDAQPGVINQALLRLRINNKRILPEYFLKLFQTSFFQRKVLVETRGSAMLNIAGVKELKKITFNLPSIEIQKKQLEEVSEVESTIAGHKQELNASIRQAELLRSSILKRAFEGELL